MRAVEITPVALPAASASSKIEVTGLARAAAQIADGDRLVDADDVVAGLDARDHRGGGRRGVGDLAVMAVGLGEREEGEGVDREVVRLAIDATLLALEDTGRGYGRDGHAVGHHDDDVLRLAGDRLRLEAPGEVGLRGGEVAVGGLRQGVLGERGGGEADAGEQHGSDTDHRNPPDGIVAWANRSRRRLRGAALRWRDAGVTDR